MRQGPGARGKARGGSWAGPVANEQHGPALQGLAPQGKGFWKSREATLRLSISYHSEGNRLVFIRLQNPRPDSLALPPFRPKQSTQVVAAGIPTDANDLGVYRASMVISGEFCSILWSETSNPGQWEGFPVFSASDFRVYGVLLGGVNIAPLTEASLRTWLEQLETGSPRVTDHLKTAT